MQWALWQHSLHDPVTAKVSRYLESGVKKRFNLVQSLSRVQLFATPWIAACQASLSITNSRSSPKLMSIESVMPSSHLILCRPPLLLPPIPPSIRVFSNESTDAGVEASILWPPDSKSQLIGRGPDAGKDWRQKEKRTAENEMIRQHHQFSGHEFEQTLGDSEGQWSLVCCSPWGHKESDTS